MGTQKEDVQVAGVEGGMLRPLEEHPKYLAVFSRGSKLDPRLRGSRSIHPTP